MMWRTFSLLVSTVVVLVTAGQKKDKTPPVTIMTSGSSMAETVLAHFNGNQHSEVILQKVMKPETGETVYRYQWESKHPIKEVYLIPPHHIQIDGSERDYVEGKDFSISCTRKSVTVESKHLGFYHMSVITIKASGRGRRAIELSKNVILNAGLMETCGDACSEESCSLDHCDNLTRVNFECPPYDDCSFISEDATLGLAETMNGTIIDSCMDFTTGVCNKYEDNGNETVDILIQAHGANGIFCFGPPGGPAECVSKGSACYRDICDNLSGKISSLTIYSCSVAGGDSGTDLMQCMANCLNAEVKAYKKVLYLGSTGGESLMWATAEGFEEPCVVTPTPSSMMPSSSTTSGTSTITTSTSMSTTNTSTSVRSETVTPEPTMIRVKVY